MPVRAAHFVNLALKGDLRRRAARDAAARPVSTTGPGGGSGFLRIPSSSTPAATTSSRRRSTSTTARTGDDSNGRLRTPTKTSTPSSTSSFCTRSSNRTTRGTTRVPEEILAGIRAAPRRANILIHELGYFLGQQIHDAYRAGVIDRREITLLFRSSFPRERQCPEDLPRSHRARAPALQSGSTPQPATQAGEPQAS